MIKRFYNIIRNLLFNKKSKEEAKEEELQLFEERFLNIFSSKEYGDMLSKQMLEAKQRAKQRAKERNSKSKIYLIILNYRD